jgi:hypothetical protein
MISQKDGQTYFFQPLALWENTSALQTIPHLSVGIFLI